VKGEGKRKRDGVTDGGGGREEGGEGGRAESEKKREMVGMERARAGRGFRPRGLGV
jgi:hypothetical protein